MSRLAPGESFTRSDAETAVSLIPGIRDRLFIQPAGNVPALVDADHLEWLQPGTVTVRMMA